MLSFFLTCRHATRVRSRVDCSVLSSRDPQKRELLAFQDAQLREIFHQLGMASSTATSMAANPCAALSIGCNANGQIIGLYLSGIQLPGEIPPELGQLKYLEGLYLADNQLSGEIPREIGELKKLQLLYLHGNRLSGKIPREIGELKQLQMLYLHGNRLSGKIPLEVGQLKMLQMLCLQQNQLSGDIPREIGQLKNLNWLDFSQNQLSGEIPREIGQLEKLQKLHLHFNQLSGSIPSEALEIGKVRGFEEITLSHNQLSGDIPREFGLLEKLQRLSLSENQLMGAIPDELGQLQYLEQLLFHSNQLTAMPYVFNMSSLKVLDISENQLSGELGRELFPQLLEVLDLSHNKFAGDIWNITDNFCALIPKGGSLKELRLNHNKFTGQIPPCLMQFERLNFLALNDNRFHGALPEIEASQLVILTLHKNALTGVLPKTLYTLAHLGVLTLHENSIGGGLEGLNLSVPCLDNSRFRMWVYWNCKRGSLIRPLLSGDELQQLDANCPRSNGACPRNGLANITLHHNRFSCAVPESLGNSEVSSLAIMGNMLGNGSLLNAPWISREEQQPFLYYSPKAWKSTMPILTGCLMLTTSAALCHQKLRRKLEEASLNLSNISEARVVASNLALWRGGFCACVGSL